MADPVHRCQTPALLSPSIRLLDALLCQKSILRRSRAANTFWIIFQTSLLTKTSAHVLSWHLLCTDVEFRTLPGGHWRPPHSTLGTHCGRRNTHKERKHLQGQSPVEAWVQR